MSIAQTASTSSSAASRSTSSGAAPASPSRGQGPTRAALRSAGGYEAQQALLAPVQAKTTSGAAALGTATATTKADAASAKANTAALADRAGALVARGESGDLGDLLKAKAAEVSTIEGLCLGIGGAIEGCTQGPGSSAEASASLLAQLVAAYMKLDLKLEVEQTEEGFKVAGVASIAAGLGRRGGSVRGYIGLKASVGFEAKGDSGAECVRLIMLAIEQGIREEEANYPPEALEAMIEESEGIRDRARAKLLAGKNPDADEIARLAANEEVLKKWMASKLDLIDGNWVADCIFGADHTAKVMAAMDKAGDDEADTIKTFGEIGLEFGLGVGKEKSAEVNYNVAAGQETTLGKDARGKLSSETKKTNRVTMEGKLGTISGKLEQKGEARSAEMSFEVPKEKTAAAAVSAFITSELVRGFQAFCSDAPPDRLQDYLTKLKSGAHFGKQLLDALSADPKLKMAIGASIEKEPGKPYAIKILSEHALEKEIEGAGGGGAKLEGKTKKVIAAFDLGV